MEKPPPTITPNAKRRRPKSRTRSTDRRTSAVHRSTYSMESPRPLLLSLLLLLYYLFTSSYTLSYIPLAHVACAKRIVLVTTYACFITSAYLLFSELDYPGKRTNGKGSYGTYFLFGRIANTFYLLFLSRCVCMKVYLHWSRAFRLSMVVCSWHRIASVVVRVRDGTTLQETGGRKLMVRSVRTPACAFPGWEGGSTPTLLTGVMFQGRSGTPTVHRSVFFFASLLRKTAFAVPSQNCARTALLPAKIPHHDLPEILTYVHCHAVNSLSPTFIQSIDLIQHPCATSSELAV